MPERIDLIIDQLRQQAIRVAPFSRAPYSGRQEACILLLSDGSWIPGVRVESASFSLTIPPILNALTTATALGRDDVLSIVQSAPFREEDQTFLRTNTGHGVTQLSDDVFVSGDPERFPAPVERLSPFQAGEPPDSPRTGIAMARRIAIRARVQESGFRVGALAVTGTGQMIPGVNVEYPDWSRILCAERNALGTAISYGHPSIKAMYLTCPSDPGCSPCGACRQLLAELSPEATLWIDRGEQEPQRVRPEELLPGFFSGAYIPLHS